MSSICSPTRSKPSLAARDSDALLSGAIEATKRWTPWAPPSRTSRARLRARSPAADSRGRRGSRSPRDPRVGRGMEAGRPDHPARAARLRQTRARPSHGRAEGFTRSVASRYWTKSSSCSGSHRGTAASISAEAPRRRRDPAPRGTARSSTRARGARSGSMGRRRLARRQFESSRGSPFGSAHAALNPPIPVRAVCVGKTRHKLALDAASLAESSPGYRSHR